MNLSTYESKKIIKECVSKRTLYDVLEEEALELAQAASKLKRAEGLSEDNPTPTTRKQAEENLIEELQDVMNVLEILGVEFKNDPNNYKIKRWAMRILSSRD